MNLIRSISSDNYTPTNFSRIVRPHFTFTYFLLTRSTLKYDQTLFWYFLPSYTRRLYLVACRAAAGGSYVQTKAILNNRVVHKVCNVLGGQRGVAFYNRGEGPVMRDVTLQKQ